VPAEPLTPEELRDPERPKVTTPSTQRGQWLLQQPWAHSTACEYVLPGDPCDCKLPEAIAAIEAEAAALDEDTLGLIRDLADAYHQTGSLRDHADPEDWTVWNPTGIETCADELCDAATAIAAAYRARVEGRE